MNLLATLIAASLFGLNTTEAERLEKIKPFFDPPPNSSVQISTTDLKKSNRAVLKKIRGFITVKPPPGSCFEVTRNQKQPSDYVCKQTPLAFDLTDIDRFGKLTWEVKTSIDDIGTVLHWNTPYRTIIAVPRKRNDRAQPNQANPEEFWQSEPPQYLLIKSCQDLSNRNSRRIELKLFNGESWRIYFPNVHQLLPQPDQAPNLEITNATAKRSLSDAAQDKKTDDTQNADKKEEPKETRPNNHEDRKNWTISLRNSFEMSSDNLHVNNTNTSGGRGRCRYNFSGPDEDPTTGRIECQDTAEYHMVLIPATCIAAVKGDRP